MKWFQHCTDSHTNLKHREILADFGLEGYAVYWICLELVGQQGIKYRLNASKSWLKALKDITKLPQEKIEEMLLKYGELNLICRKSLGRQELYIPKMREYSDDYTKRVRRVSVESSLRIDKNRLDKITLEYIRLQGWEKSIKENPLLLSDIYKRNCGTAKRLILALDNDELLLKAMRKMASVYKTKGLSWTLETLARHIPEFIKDKSSIENFIKQDSDIREFIKE